MPASVSGAIAMPPALKVSRSSICTNSPESGRLDQSALAVTWKSTTRPSPSPVPVTSGVPSSRLASTRPGRSGSGCAITWLEMSTSCGTGSPANGLVSGNGLSRRGAPQDIAPPIERPPARSLTGSSGSSSSCPTPEVASRGPAKRTSSPPFSTQGISSARSASPRRPTSARISTSGAAFSISCSGASITSANGTSALRR